MSDTDSQIDLAFPPARPRAPQSSPRQASPRERHVSETIARIEARVHEHAHDTHRETHVRDTEARLRSLERQYRSALSRGVVAKAHYLALLGDRRSTPAAIDRAQRQWQLLQLQRKAFASRMGTIERRERNATAV